MTKSKNKSQVTENAQLPKWRNRIVGHGEEDPEQLLANPKNWRIHPKNQQDALVQNQGGSRRLIRGNDVALTCRTRFRNSARRRSATLRFTGFAAVAFANELPSVVLRHVPRCSVRTGST